MGHNLSKEPVSKGLHLALTDGIRRADDIDAGKGLKSVLERSNQPSGGEIGCNQRVYAFGNRRRIARSAICIRR
jgi:hypothetical protein